MATNTGIKNEIEIESHLSARKTNSLNPNLRAFITDVFNPTEFEKKTVIIDAKRTNDTRYKPDMIIRFAQRRSNVSIKQGSGNSVHQEPIWSFVDYIKNDLGASNEVVESLLFFHWGDGTLDGRGEVSARMSAREVIERYPEKIVVIQNFFNEHEDELLERFLSSGINKVSHVDYLYYGSYLLADWKSISEVYRNLKDNPKSVLSVGGLNFQTYGRSLNGQDDARRRSIQLKWSDMEAFFLVGKKSIVDVGSKIKGDNSHGFRNVQKIIEAINGKKFEHINDGLKEFLFTIFDGKCKETDTINAEQVKNGLKGDILIWLNSDRQNIKNVAVASGSGNSVHQENVYSFCNFLKNELEVDGCTIDEYLRFHFADGTNDNSGDSASRQSAGEYKKQNSASLRNLERQFAIRGKVILERLIKKNDGDYPDVDYFFYGDTELPYWARIDTLIQRETTKKPNPRAALAIGDFSFQSWNRSLGGRADQKRLSMQVKWNNLLKNISVAHKEERADNTVFSSPLASMPETAHRPSKTTSEIVTNKAIQGIGYEYKFTSSLNEDRCNPIWKTLEVSEKNAYFVNVSYNQVSKMAGSKVPPKSDCYVVQSKSDVSQLLEENNYVLTEEMLIDNGIAYEVVPGSGISIKLPTSKNYTLQKLSFPAFQNIFPSLSTSYFVAALLFVDPAQTYKNDLILATFEKTVEELCSDLGTQKSPNDQETLKQLKTKALSSIKTLANDDKDIYKTLCFGEEMFDDPFVASYIFENGRLLHKDDYRTTISVTTGSGRSKGVYTLVFK